MGLTWDLLGTHLGLNADGIVSVTHNLNHDAKVLLFNPFLEALKTEKFGRYGVTVNTYKANRLYYTSICVRW